MLCGSESLGPRHRTVERTDDERYPGLLATLGDPAGRGWAEWRDSVHDVEVSTCDPITKLAPDHGSFSSFS